MYKILKFINEIHDASKKNQRTETLISHTVVLWAILITSWLGIGITEINRTGGLDSWVRSIHTISWILSVCRVGLQNGKNDRRSDEKVMYIFKSSLGLLREWLTLCRKYRFTNRSFWREARMKCFSSTYRTRITVEDCSLLRTKRSL